MVWEWDNNYFISEHQKLSMLSTVISNQKLPDQQGLLLSFFDAGRQGGERSDWWASVKETEMTLHKIYPWLEANSQAWHCCYGEWALLTEMWPPSFLAANGWQFTILYCTLSYPGCILVYSRVVHVQQVCYYMSVSAISFMLPLGWYMWSYIANDISVLYS